MDFWCVETQSKSRSQSRAGSVGDVTFSALFDLHCELGRDPRVVPATGGVRLQLRVSGGQYRNPISCACLHIRRTPIGWALSSVKTSQRNQETDPHPCLFCRSFWRTRSMSTLQPGPAWCITVSTRVSTGQHGSARSQHASAYGHPGQRGVSVRPSGSARASAGRHAGSGGRHTATPALRIATVSHAGCRSTAG